MFLKAASLIAVLTITAFVMERLITRFSRDNEPLRKLVHVFHAIGLALLAFVIPLELLVGIELFFLGSVVVARYLSENFSKAPWIKYFARVYKVGRISYGEFFYPVSVIMLVFLADSRWEFAAAILVLGIADAAAALIGKRYGDSTSYKVFGQKKSLVGSAAFLLVALMIVAGFVLFSGVASPETGLLAVLGVSLVLTATENLGIYGSDNLLVPLVAIMLLNRL